MQVALALAKRNFWSPLKVSEEKEYNEGACKLVDVSWRFLFTYHGCVGDVVFAIVVIGELEQWYLGARVKLRISKCINSLFVVYCCPS